MGIGDSDVFLDPLLEIIAFVDDAVAGLGEDGRDLFAEAIVGIAESCWQALHNGVVVVGLCHVGCWAWKAPGHGVGSYRGMNRIAGPMGYVRVCGDVQSEGSEGDIVALATSCLQVSGESCSACLPLSHFPLLRWQVRTYGWPGVAEERAGSTTVAGWMLYSESTYRLDLHKSHPGEVHTSRRSLMMYCVAGKPRGNRGHRPESVSWFVSPRQYY